MRCENDPRGGRNPIIDKIVGNGYTIIKFVAQYMREIVYVADNMEAIYITANGGVKRQTTLTTTIVDGTPQITVTPHVVKEHIENISVQIKQGNSIYFPDPSLYTFKLENETLIVTLNASQTAFFRDGLVVAIITTNTPVGSL